VTVKDGDTVFDAATSSVVSLTKGTRLNQLDGSSLTYDGSGSAKRCSLGAVDPGGRREMGGRHSGDGRR